MNARAWESFFLIDVGASGGIAEYWSGFGPTLRAIGIEPLIAEVDRLNRDEQRPGVRYEAAFVTVPGFDRMFPPDVRNDPVRSRDNSVYQRLSSARAQELMAMDYRREVFNQGVPAVTADRWVSLDDLLAEEERRRVDFVKVDTDGHDLEVLLGGRGVLERGVLGLMVEAQLHGPSHDYGNTFANIDRLLRSLGFSLFDIDLFRYSRAALPSRFIHPIPAQTEAGQVVWGDALYLRDLGDPAYEQKHGFEITRERVMKLAALFSLFQLPDCAAEVLLNREDLVGSSSNGWVDLAAQDAGLRSGDYAAYIKAFERDPRVLYPSGLQRVTPLATVPERLNALIDRLQGLSVSPRAGSTEDFAGVVLDQADRHLAVVKEMAALLDGAIVGWDAADHAAALVMVRALAAAATALRQAAAMASSQLDEARSEIRQGGSAFAKLEEQLAELAASPAGQPG